MAKRAAAKTLSGETGAALAPFPLDFSAAEAVVQATDACAKACLEWQQEVTRFTAARLQADLQIPVSLAGCRDVADVMTVQQKWLAETVQDYAGEAGRLMEIAGRAARDGMACWRDAEPAAVHDVAESTQVID